jgi:hypothetical protein
MVIKGKRAKHDLVRPPYYPCFQASAALYMRFSVLRHVTPFKMGPTGCPKTSVTYYKWTLHNISQERKRRKPYYFTLYKNYPHNGCTSLQAGLWSRYTKASTPTPNPRFLKFPTPTPQFLKLRFRLLHQSSIRINNGKPVRHFITTTWIIRLLFRLISYS